MIPLMKNAFLNEHETRMQLIKFIQEARRLSMDEQCLRFEEEFASFQGSRDAVFFNSGSSANLAMIQVLKNLGWIKDRDLVGFSALTWATNVMPIIQLGLVPVPVDCDPTTLNVMAHTLKECLKHNDLKMLFITNALGFCGDLDKIRDICAEKNILLIEDNCEALGTELPAGRTGSFGPMASFSFFVAHHMSTVEGGMVTTDNDELAEMLRIVRANGWDRNLTAGQQRKWRKNHQVMSEFEAKYTFYDLGFNLRPTEITAFLGRNQLRYLKENIKVRQDNYTDLDEIVKKNPDLISLNREHIKKLSSFAFPILCRTPALKEIYLDQFAGGGVEIRPMIAGNIQRQPFFRKHVREEYALPGADQIHDCGFYCGNYPELTRQDKEVLRSCLSKY